MPSARPLVFTLVALAACTGSPGNPGTDTAGMSTTGTDASTTAVAATTGSGPGTTGDPAPTTSAATTTTTGGEAGLTYYRDVKAILDAKCATCHRPGDIAPFSLTNYAEASMFAPVFAPAVEDRSMPPWPPSAECNGFAHDRSLTEEERATVLEWIAIGAPEGDPADAPPPIPDDAEPIDYDVQIGIAEPFTPADVVDDYRCFLLDWPKDQPSYATAFTIEPGAREIVHHVIAFIIPPDELADFEALDAADPGPGYPCYGGPGGEASPRAQWLGAWVPGANDGALPQDTGILVQPGSKIAMQMHYHPVGGAPIADQSTIMVRTAETVARPAYLLPLAHPGWMIDSPEMTIPAGEADVMHAFTIDVGSVIWYLYGDGAPGLGVPLLAHMAGVHMHTRGVRASLTIDGGAPDSCLIDVPNWDFGWQGIYEFAAPITIEPTDQVRLECHFDNSAGDAPLKWGEGTGDEMCLGMLYVSAPAP